MLLIDEENETPAPGRMSEFSGSDVSLQAVKTRWLCCPKTKVIGWDEVNQK